MVIRWKFVRCKVRGIKSRNENSQKIYIRNPIFFQKIVRVWWKVLKNQWTKPRWDVRYKVGGILKAVNFARDICFVGKNYVCLESPYKICAFWIEIAAFGAKQRTRHIISTEYSQSFIGSKNLKNRHISRQYFWDFAAYPSLSFHIFQKGGFDLEVIVHYPKDSEKKKELETSVSKLRAEFIIDYINKLNCPYEQKLQLADAVAGKIKTDV